MVCLFIEYQPQYNQNNQQSSQQPQRPIVTSTYRPTVVTTVAPTSQREQPSYVTSPRTTYQQRPSYQADYDDALVSQVWCCGPSGVKSSCSVATCCTETRLINDSLQLEDDRYNQKQTHTQLRYFFSVFLLFSYYLYLPYDLVLLKIRFT